MRWQSFTTTNNDIRKNQCNRRKLKKRNHDEEKYCKKKRKKTEDFNTNCTVQLINKKPTINAYNSSIGDLILLNKRKINRSNNLPKNSDLFDVNNSNIRRNESNFNGTLLPWSRYLFRQTTNNYKHNTNISTNKKKKKYFNSFSLMLLIFISIFVTILLMPTLISSEFSSSILSQQSKNSGQLFISDLCGKSQFPALRKIEGAVLTSVGDIDVNCTITFRTKSARQHFAIRFEELKLGCDDHLKMFDGDVDYGQTSIKDFSCKDNLASVPLMKTTGTFLTLRFSTDSRTHRSDGFRLILTAIFDTSMNWDCPADYSYCQNRLCISRSLFCDDVNHCLDNSDEVDCSSRFGGIISAGNGAGAGGRYGADGGSDSSFYVIDPTFKFYKTFMIIGIIILIIFVCVMLFSFWRCYNSHSHYNQYQHHLQRTIGVPLQTSASLMFAQPHQLQYQYFQPTNLSPYVTPQHHATLANHHLTLPRGYSTLPLNLARANPQQQQATYQLQPTAQNHLPLTQETKQGQCNNNTEYLMMTGLAPESALRATPSIQTNLFMPTSQSILTTGIRYQPTTLTQAPMMAQQQQTSEINILKQLQPVTTNTTNNTPQHENFRR